MTFKYGEDLLQFIWQYQLYNQKLLKTTDGSTLQVIHQGYLNRNSGPDFENAQIKIDGISFYGAIEIHLNSSDWDNHKHQYDKAYNNVILHVCLTEVKQALREDGTKVPTVLLQNRIVRSSLENYAELMNAGSFIACEQRIGSIPPIELAGWLNRIIIERLEDRCNQYEEYLKTSSGNWNQAFYKTIVRCFGMPVNSACFEEIADELSFDLIQKHHKSIFQLEALLFGTAGLLEKELDDNYYIGLKNEYQFLKKKYGLNLINSQLKFGKMRPMNSPYIRLAQIAALFHHVPDFISLVLNFPSLKEITGSLDFELSEYWNTHYSFNSTSKMKKKKISSSFINHLFLNAIVPFTFFYQKKKTDENGEVALTYLEDLPSEKNSLIDKWLSIGVKSESALISQALLQLHKYYCKPKRCLHCTIGRKILVKNN